MTVPHMRMAEALKLRPWLRVAAAVMGTFGIGGAVLAFSHGYWTDAAPGVVVAYFGWAAAVTGESPRVGWTQSRNPSGD